MNVLDLAIVLVLALSMYLGFRRGMIRLVIAQVGAILVLIVVVRNPQLMDRIVPPSIPRIAVLGAILLLTGIVVGIFARVVVKALYAVPLVASVDKPAGIAVNGLIALVGLYLLVSALVTFDGVLQPIHRFARLGPAQVAQLQQRLSGYPGAALFVDRHAIDALRGQGAGSPVPVADLGRYDAYLGFYENKLRPQLVDSSIAPILLSLGEKLPVIGHHQDFPRPETRDQPAS